MKATVRSITLTLLLSITCVFSSQPEITELDAKNKMEEILTSHVKYKIFNAEIAARALKCFLKELDPTKSYFLLDEIAPLEDPSDALINKIVNDYHNAKFTEFRKIMDLLSSAIERHRDILEDNEKVSTLPDPTPFKLAELEWQKNIDELKAQLLLIRSLQVDSVSKLSIEAQERYFQKIKKYRRAHEDNFLGEETKENQFISSVLKAISSALDTHTFYFTPQEANLFMIQVQKRLFGIGALLRDDLSGLTIMRIIDGSPAHHSKKIKEGDRIIAVDGDPIVGMDISDAVELIRGPQGTSVQLTLLRDLENEEEEKTTEKYDETIVRDEIVIKESRYDSSIEPFGNGAIAHLRLHSFYEDPKSSSAKDLEAALKKIQEEHNLKGVILDLRSNLGGLLSQAVHVAGLFMKKGIVVSTKDSSGKIIHFRHQGSHPVWDGPLLILTDRLSASSSEIVAQSLQDYGRALVVGDDHTDGKGSYQVSTVDVSGSRPINPTGEYKVTRGLYYTVSGKSPQLKGVLSDIGIPGGYSQSDIGEKYGDFPLEPGEIAPNFEDDFEDVHIFDRIRLKHLFKVGRQEKEALYEPYLKKLRLNSEERIKNSQNYQNFLKELEKPYHSSDSLENYGKNDLQLEEAINVMKDLLFLMKPHRS